MQQVISNLLNNAFYATWQKKQQAGDRYIPSVSIEMYPIGKNVEIKIRDNGMGIPQAVKEKIFTPFFTTKPPGQGTGFGLSLSYSIVVFQHAGTLSFNSVEGEFTEFVIALPRF